MRSHKQHNTDGPTRGFLMFECVVATRESSGRHVQFGGTSAHAPASSKYTHAVLQQLFVRQHVIVAGTRSVPARYSTAKETSQLPFAAHFCNYDTRFTPLRHARAPKRANAMGPQLSPATGSRTVVTALAWCLFNRTAAEPACTAQLAWVRHGPVYVHCVLRRFDGLKMFGEAPDSSGSTGRGSASYGGLLLLG